MRIGKKKLSDAAKARDLDTAPAVGAEPEGDASQLAAEILDWEAQFGPSGDGDVCEVAGEDMARWARMARAIVGGQA